MDSPVLQNTIKLIGFQVVDINFKLDPSCQLISEFPEKEKLNIELNLGLGFNEEKKNNYTVSFDLKLNDSSSYIYLLIKSVAIFETKDPITDEFKDSGFIKVNSPAIAFPFLRSFVNTLTANAGINPIILPAFNFTKQETPQI